MLKFDFEAAPVQDAVTNLATERVIERIVEVPEQQVTTAP